MATLAAMQQPTDHPTDAPTDPVVETATDAAPAVSDGPAEEPAGDTVLDGFESDLDDVAAALDALDADDLDQAEALATRLASEAETDAAPASSDDHPPAGYE